MKTKQDIAMEIFIESMSKAEGLSILSEVELRELVNEGTRILKIVVNQAWDDIYGENT